MMTDSPNYVPKVADGIAMLQAAHDRMEALIETLIDDEIDAPSTPTDWSVKDHLTHLAAWSDGIVALLNFQPRYPAMGLDETWIFREQPHYDEINAIIYEQRKHLSAEEALALWRGATARMLAKLHELTDEDILRPYSYYQPHEPGKDDPDPVKNYIAWRIGGNSFEHYDEHYPWIQERIARDRAGK